MGIRKLILPVSKENLGGKTVMLGEGDFEVVAEEERVMIARIRTKPPEISWFEKYELMYCQRQHDGESAKVIRQATDEEIKLFRVPIWIQSEEVPECCGRPMFFVGQIDDDRICNEPPEDAQYWWHDAASFYVFTCSQCMECKAVGQEF